MHFPLEDDDVLEFTSELDFYNLMDLEENPKPIFIKFFTETCPHCQGFKNAFKRYASLYKDKVTFMDVNCGSGKSGEKFCKTNKATSYPTLMLFKGDDKITFNDNDRTFIAIEKFLVKNAGVNFLDINVGSPQAATPTSQATTSTPKAANSTPKVEAQDDNDDDEKLAEELQKLKAKEEELAKKKKAKEEIAALKAKIAAMERDL